MLAPSTTSSGKTRVAVLTADDAFEQLVRATFGANSQIELQLVKGKLSAESDRLNAADAAVVIVDLDATQPEEFAALSRFAAQLTGNPPLIAVTQSLDAAVARKMVQVRVADFLVKPVEPIELVRSCARAANGASAGGNESVEAQIYTFLPSAGGVGVTTLAIQTALLLQGGKNSHASVCLVDLDFQHGAVADYLDIEPRLDLNEIEPRPERLDRQLLEVMLSRHSSGLQVIAAPSRPAEMRSFDPLVVTRLLDLVSANFEYVVIDMPRTWFSWTDDVLLGSNQLHIVSEMTVPCLKLAKNLLSSIRERLGEGCHPKVIVNRFEQRMFAPGLRITDIEKALGGAFGGVIPNNYRVVREAIDRGVPLEEVKPGNNVTSHLRKIVMLHAAKAKRPQPASSERPRLLAWARR
jgi:pilus assembly protein CpaE